MNSMLAIESGAGVARRGRVVEMDEPLQVQVARLESDVQHILTDVADIKVDVRRTNERVTRMWEELINKIDGVRDELTKKIDALSKELASAKMWAIGLYVAQSATLLFVMAKGFKWL